MGDVILAVLSLAGAYLVSLVLYPFAPCRVCRGAGTNAGSNRRRWGTCGRCGGSGKRLRAGARLLRR